MNSETCLSCEGIERYLGEEEERVHALRGVSLDIEPGSVHAVVGPSGCGKSSFLYIFGLLDLPDAGRVSIESEPVAELSDDELAHKRSKFIGFIFQFHFFMEDFTAQENVMIPMRKLGQLSDSDMRERAAGLLEAVGLGDKLRRPSRHLSGGEQQRGATPPALAKETRRILADGDAAVPFPEANNSGSPSPARWRTIRLSSWQTSRQAISIQRIRSAPLTCFKISCKKAAKLCSWPRTILSSPKPAIGPMR